jgi:hypothetical protein
VFIYGGRALDSLGGVLLTEVNQPPNTVDLELRSETMGNKVHSREGNSPDRQLRSLIMSKWERKWRLPNNQDVGLEAAIHLKSA